MHHLDLLQISILALAGLVAGAINAIAGGGSLVSFPVLLFVGYPPLMANETNTVALVPGGIGGSLAYRPELMGQWQRVRLLLASSLLGGLTGAYLLVISPASVFRHIVPWLILFSCALLLVQPLVTRVVGNHREHREHSIPMLLTQFLAAVYGGYFGAGLGVMMLALMGMFLRDSLQRLNALKGLMSLVINLISAAFFVLFGHVAWLPVVIMAVSSLAGGHFGVSIARRLSNRMLRGLIVVFGVIVAVRLLM